MAGRKVNFGVIGAGGIASRKTIPAMLKAGNCRLVGVMEVEGTLGGTVEKPDGDTIVIPDSDVADLTISLVSG